MKPTTLTVTDGVDLTGETVLVTGSSSGLGKECARILAYRGARVLMANRNERKTADAISAMANSIGREAAARLEFRECDTSRMPTVNALVDTIISRGERLSALFLNAGVFGMEFQLTEDGFERTFATNHIGHFLLVHRLISAGCLSPDARIVATQTSGIRNPFSKMDLEMLASPGAHRGRFQRTMASPNSKVLLALMMTEFARRIRVTSLPNVTFNAGDPGATLTDNVNQIGGVLGAVSRFLGPILFKSVEQGGAVLLWVATSRTLAGVSGACFSDSLRPIRLPSRCTDLQSAHQTWETTERLLGLQPWSQH